VASARTVLLGVAALGAVVLAAGCGGGGDGGRTTTEAAAAATTQQQPKAPRITVFTARLSSREAIPKGPAGASGTATITLNMRSGRACWRLTVRGVDKPVSAHVHEGLPGRLGAVVIPLGDRYSAKGCVLSGLRALREVAAAPRRYYVDVHTAKHLEGAVRGQLRAASA
jgi:hypothetical protein